MKKTRLFYLLLSGIFLACLYSCSKEEEDYNAQGGLLPTNYVNINDNSFSPNILNIAVGASITFLNKTTVSHTIVSADSSTIVSPSIAPGLSYYVKPDTLSGTSQVVIYYHCKEHPTVTGVIRLNP
jgi:plastocyanin